MQEAKPFQIEKRIIFEAFKKVKFNRGGSGLDGIEMGTYEQNLGSNLYRLWNEPHEFRQLYAQSSKTCRNTEIPWW